MRIILVTFNKTQKIQAWHSQLTKQCVYELHYIFFSYIFFFIHSFIQFSEQKIIIYIHSSNRDYINIHFFFSYWYIFKEIKRQASERRTDIHLVI